MSLQKALVAWLWQGHVLGLFLQLPNTPKGGQSSGAPPQPLLVTSTTLPFSFYLFPSLLPSWDVINSVSSLEINWNCKHWNHLWILKVRLFRPWRRDRSCLNVVWLGHRNLWTFADGKKNGLSEWKRFVFFLTIVALSWWIWFYFQFCDLVVTKILELVWDYCYCKTIYNSLCENYRIWRWFLQGCDFHAQSWARSDTEVSVPTIFTPSKLHWWNFILGLSSPMDSGMSGSKTSTCFVFRRIFYPWISLCM